MRAIGIRRFGGPDVLEAMTLPDPKPGAGEVKIKVAYAGVGPVDVHVRRGDYVGSQAQQPAWPLVLGYEGAGEVVEVGASVSGLQPGARVAWCGRPGSLAEYAVVPAWRLVPVPERLPLDIACALQLDGMLAHALSVSVFPIKAGDVVMIQGAAEPAAQLLARIAKATGATVIASVAGEAESGGPRAAGADHVVLASGGDVEARVRELTGGQGCHVVFDWLGLDTIAQSLACCRRRGMVALCGGRTGAVAAVNPDDLAAAGSIFLVRPHLSDFMQDATEVTWRMGGLFQAWLAGQLEVGVGRVLPLDGVHEAHLAIEGGTATGKILVKV